MKAAFIGELLSRYGDPQLHFSTKYAIKPSLLSRMTFRGDVITVGGQSPCAIILKIARIIPDPDSSNSAYGGVQSHNAALNHTGESRYPGEGYGII